MARPPAPTSLWPPSRPGYRRPVHAPRSARPSAEPRPEARSLADVLTSLDAIIARSAAAGSPIGYFAALYRQVTRDVERGIRQGDFEDASRMERLDVTFANRYLSAYDAYSHGRPTTRSWAVAFEAAGSWWPTVIQHLLLGMNAHINLDLGIAAAEVAPGPSLAGLEADFGRINGILASRVDGVEDVLAGIWPALRLLDIGAGRTDEAVVNFSIRRARDHAWAVARRLAVLGGEERDRAIDDVDRETALLGGLVRHPGPWIGTKLRIVRLGEMGSVSRKIDALAG
jgi:Family of unknown function (DUF5995)